MILLRTAQLLPFEKEHGALAVVPDLQRPYFALFRCLLQDDGAGLEGLVGEDVVDRGLSVVMEGHRAKARVLHRLARANLGDQRGHQMAPANLDGRAEQPNAGTVQPGPVLYLS